MTFPWTFIQIVSSSVMVQYFSHKYLSIYIDERINKSNQYVHNQISSVQDTACELKRTTDSVSLKSNNLENTLNSYCTEFNDKTSELSLKTLEISEKLSSMPTTPNTLITTIQQAPIRPDTRLLKYVKNTKFIDLDSATTRRSQYDVDSFIICFSVKGDSIIPQSTITYELKYNISQIFSLNGFIIDTEINKKTVFPTSRLTFIDPNIIQINNQDSFLKEGDALNIYIHCVF